MSNDQITPATANSILFSVVTGASSGIGACFARELAKRKQNLVLVARSKDKLESIRQEIKSKNNVGVEVVEQDLSVPGSAQQLAAVLAERDIFVDLLVNNAGFGSHGEFWELSLQRQQEMLHLNVVTLTELSSLLLPSM